MKYRQLGKTGIKVSEIGFGTWGLGGDKDGARAYGPTDDRQSQAALNRAFDLGINFYDTADFYGFGHSETLLGKVFAKRRSEVIIAGKTGFVDVDGRQNFSAKHIRASLEGSLKRLGTDYLDVYQLQSPPAELLAGGSEPLEIMKNLQKEGLIRSYGVSLRSPDDGLVLLRNSGVGSIQVNFNLADQRARLNGLFDLCRKKGVGVIVRTPLCFGFLTGQYSETSKLSESDHRRKWSVEQVGLWNNASKLFDDFLGREKQTKAQFALRFCLSYDAVSTVIPGMLTVAQVEENAASSKLGALPAGDLKSVESLYARHDFFIQKKSKKILTL
jgi:aryl-alcohol dehydrogenase-like predicted oxidoreductase